jgi:hypothetical protein
MSSVTSADVLALAARECDVVDADKNVELTPTRLVALGSTVVSPMASLDVHFRKSSTAEGWKRERDIVR